MQVIPMWRRRDENSAGPFFFFFQHKQSYVSFYSNLSFDTNVTMVILDNIEPFNHQIDDFPYMHS